MSAMEWLAAGMLLAGIVLFAQWQRNRDLDARANVVRALLELPENVVFADIRPINKSARTSPSVAAIVRLSAFELDAYMSRFEKPLWDRNIPRFGDAPLLPISPGNIMWRSRPLPASVGSSRVGWSNLSERAVPMIRNGRTLCIALQQRPTQRGESGWFALTSGFTARDCTYVPRTDERLTIVLAAIDVETRMMHIQIN